MNGGALFYSRESVGSSLCLRVLSAYPLYELSALRASIDKTLELWEE